MHAHTGSFNAQGQRSSADSGHHNITPMLNQFSFGHLQSTDRQNCAASETHHVMRESDSIKQE